jgi:hypothetical protein
VERDGERELQSRQQQCGEIPDTLLSPQIDLREVENFVGAAVDDRIVPFDTLLAPHRVHHRRLQPFAERQEFLVCACASGTAQDRHVAVAVQEGG